MNRSLGVVSCALGAGLLVLVIPAAALASSPSPSTPDAPTVTSSITGDKAILTITGEPGATATVFGDDRRALAGASLANGTARVVLPAPQGITNTFAVSQTTTTGASSAETTTTVSEGNTALLTPVELVYAHAQDSENGTIAQFVVSGAAHAVAKVKDAEGTVLAVSSLGDDGKATLTIQHLSHGATEVAITQTLGFATSVPVENTIVGELEPQQIADTGSKAFYRVIGAPHGDAVVFDADGNEIARTAITPEGSYLAVPHTAGTPETISLYREVDGVRSTGWKRTLSGAVDQPQAPNVSHNPADDTDGMLGVRIMKDPGLFGWSLPGATVTFESSADGSELSKAVPTDFDGESNLVYLPRSAFEGGGPIIVYQTFEGIESHWITLDL